MSAKDNACRKFQANIFNKNKCQNCFKARDAHLLSDEDFTQAKPIYGGWLLLAPEGTNFDNPLHRSRKWQRRFFLLYEHGLLRYALDDMASTLPQGTINLNQCVDVVDGESRTGQKHSLCICTPDKDHYIRAEKLFVLEYGLVKYYACLYVSLFLSLCVQEPGPAKVTVTSTSSSSSMVCLPSTIAQAKRVPSTRATLWQEETWSRATLPTSCSTGSLSQLGTNTQNSLETNKNKVMTCCVNLAAKHSADNILKSTKYILNLIVKIRTETFYTLNTVFFFVNVGSLLISSIIFQPDLLNFKKGWMTKLYEDGLWKKHWFVLTDQSLRFYRDSIAEEAADVDGEVDLSTCYDVTEFPVQRNYGFQILSKEGLFTLSAMTSGIRRNWIQAILKNMRPTVAPDVTRSLPEERTRSNVEQNYIHSVVEAKKSHEDITDSAPTSDHRKSRVNKREGRSKTFDWSEFRPGQENKSGQPSIKRADTSMAPKAGTVNATTVAEPPSKLPHKVPQEQVRMDVDHARDAQEVDSKSTARRNSDVQVEIEQRWHQVETTPLREEKQVPITGSSNVPVGERAELTPALEKELGQAQRDLARLQQQNSILQEQLQDAHGREQSAREGYVLQATCERGFAAMEETHQKVIEDIQRQHQREIRKLLEEKERLLEEETNATIAAIEAMKNAHREELEKSQRSQMSGVSADIQELRRQYEEELQSIHRELEVLSEQYSQKCLENAHLAQALEAERQALGQCQRENQKLHIHNQELNHRLNEEITRMHSCISEDKSTSSLTQGKDIYELEVLLRVKESEIQYLKQEINSLKDELQSALRDKKYASDKYKDIYTELSIVKAKADCDINKLREKLLAATEALGELDAEGSGVTAGYDIMKSKSNPDFLKKEKSKQIRGVRSKSLKEGLTVQERMKLFETKDSRKI
uniref:Centrosome-associated protein CEP250-like n=1 Tax=Sinocyclocheilus anshuiensis TaxID=1608454 RepID=A0A671RBL1_9TELE